METQWFRYSNVYVCSVGGGVETQWFRYSSVYVCSVGGGWRHSGSDIAMFMCVQ